MAWADLEPELRRAIETVLTPKQLNAYQLREQGLSLREIAYGTGISVSTVRSTLDRADQKVTLALRRVESSASG